MLKALNSNPDRAEILPLTFIDFAKPAPPDNTKEPVDEDVEFVVSKIETVPPINAFPAKDRPPDTLKAPVVLVAPNDEVTLKPEVYNLSFIES